MAITTNPLFNQTSGKIGSLVVSSNGVIRERVYRNPSSTTAQVKQRANLSGLAQTWRTLPPANMAQWAALESQMNMTRTSAPSGYRAYMQVNGSLLACGKPAVQTAPATPAPAPALPPLLVSATIGDSGFALQVQSAAYANMVQVYATAPASAGRNSFRSSDYKLIGTLSGLSAGSTALTALYTARFAAPVANQKIAVQLYPISAQGFRGSPITAVAPTVSSKSADASAAPAEGEAAPALKAA